MSQDLNLNFTLKDCLFGGVKLARNPDPVNMYMVTVVLDSPPIQNYHYLRVAWVEMSLFLDGLDMSLFVHIDIKKKDILIIDIGPTQELDDTMLSAEKNNKKSRSNKNFYSGLHYNGSNNFLFAKVTKIYQFKTNDSKIEKYPLCLRTILRDF